MKRVIKNVPTNKLHIVFSDLTFEFPCGIFWASPNGTGFGFWDVYYETD
jgi:hypothetical protein